MSSVLKFKPHIQRKPEQDLQKFFIDTLCLFDRSISGHMNPYAFNVPLSIEMAKDYVRGADWWEQFIRECTDYYLYSEESELISSVANKITSCLPESINIVDLGPGSEEAVEHKTIPIISKLKNPTKYIAVDIVERFAFDAARCVTKKLNISSQSIHEDFLYKKFSHKFDNPTMMILFGGLLCNTPVYADGTTIQNTLIKFLKNIRQSLPKDGYFLISQDSNNDKESLLKAYQHPKLALYILSVLHRIKRDLPTENFYPDAFDFLASFDEESHLIKLSAVSRFAMQFKIGDQWFSTQKGDEYCLVNSFKFPIEFFSSIFEMSGFKRINTFQGENNRIALHLFKTT